MHVFLCKIVPCVFMSVAVPLHLGDGWWYHLSSSCCLVMVVSQGMTQLPAGGVLYQERELLANGSNRSYFTRFDWFPRVRDGIMGTEYLASTPACTAHPPELAFLHYDVWFRQDSPEEYLRVTDA